MTKYKSKYAELSFYVDGALYSFNGGVFATDDAKVKAALENVTDAVKVEESKPEAVPAKPKAAPKKATASAK